MTVDQSAAEAAEQRAVTLAGVGRTADALDEVNAALTQFPDHARLHALRARSLNSLGRPDEALEAAETAISIDPDLGSAHSERAEALIAAGGDRTEAVLAAATGVELDPDDTAQFTLVWALLERANRGFRRGYRRRDVDEAEERARLIGEAWPTSPLGSLALALVSLARARRLHHEVRYRWWLMPVLLAVAPLAIPWLLVDNIVGSIRRAPHLRDADRHLHAALALDPQNAYVQSLAGDVLELRRRWTRAVDYGVGAAALDADAVDAEELVVPLGRRITGATVVALIAWLVAVYPLDGLLSRSAGVVVAVVLALGAMAAVASFRQSQARLLPPRLRLELNARAGPLIAAAAVTAYLANRGADGLRNVPETRTWWVASAWVAPMAAVLTVVLLVGFISARRTIGPGRTRDRR